MHYFFYKFVNIVSKYEEKKTKKTKKKNSQKYFLTILRKYENMKKCHKYLKNGAKSTFSKKS